MIENHRPYCRPAHTGVDASTAGPPAAAASQGGLPSWAAALLHSLFAYLPMSPPPPPPLLAALQLRLPPLGASRGSTADQPVSYFSTSPPGPSTAPPSSGGPPSAKATPGVNSGAAGSRLKGSTHPSKASSGRRRQGRAVASIPPGRRGYRWLKWVNTVLLGEGGTVKTVKQGSKQVWQYSVK
jgi:hypothetical protein